MVKLCCEDCDAEGISNRERAIGVWNSVWQRAVGAAEDRSRAESTAWYSCWGRRASGVEPRTAQAAQK